MYKLGKNNTDFRFGEGKKEESWGLWKESWATTSLVSSLGNDSNHEAISVIKEQNI
jgi:hypothetical protein